MFLVIRKWYLRFIIKRKKYPLVIHQKTHCSDNSYRIADWNPHSGAVTYRGNQNADTLLVIKGEVFFAEYYSSTFEKVVNQNNLKTILETYDQYLTELQEIELLT